MLQRDWPLTTLQNPTLILIMVEIQARYGSHVGMRTQHMPPHPEIQRYRIIPRRHHHMPQMDICRPVHRMALDTLPIRHSLPALPHSRLIRLRGPDKIIMHPFHPLPPRHRGILQADLTLHLHPLISLLPRSTE
jgi:hypothetical protein